MMKEPDVHSYPPTMSVLLSWFLRINRWQRMVWQIISSTIDQARNSKTLTTELKLAIRTKLRGLLPKDIVLWHHNQRPNIASHTIDTLQKICFEVLQHPPYSSSRTPFNYPLFGHCNHFVDGSSTETKRLDWRTIKLVGRQTSCIDKQEDYVKNNVLVFSKDWLK